jgi:hypothetical protein
MFSKIDLSENEIFTCEFFHGEFFGELLYLGENNCIDKQEDKSVIEDINTVQITIAKDDGGCSDCQKNQETSIHGALQCNTEEEFTLQLQALRTKV